jgi:hypothetical protein
MAGVKRHVRAMLRVSPKTLVVRGNILLKVHCFSVVQCILRVLSATWQTVNNAQNRTNGGGCWGRARLGQG